MNDAARSGLQHALTLYQSGDLGASEKLLKKILRRQPRQPDGRHLLGLIAFQRGKHRVAAQQISQAVTASPNNPTFLCNLGAAQFETGAVVDAITSYERAIALRPSYPQALTNLGLAYAWIGDHQLAEAAHRQAAKLVPKEAEAHFNLANDLAALGRHDEAISEFNRALQREPNHVEARSNLASSYRACGDYATAINQFTEVVRHAPDNALIHFNLANVLHEAGHLDAAQEAYRTTIKHDPTLIEAKINLAAVHVDLGEPEAAIDLYEACRKERPSDVALLAALVSLYEQTSQLDQAHATLRIGLATAPDDPRLTFVEARLRQRSGDLAAAREKLISLLDVELDTDLAGEVALELGAVCDRLDDWDGAFAAWIRGNRTMADHWSSLPASRRPLSEYRARVSRNGRWFTRERLQTVPMPPTEDRVDPTFFVGFPRSGTTLLEQILASHPAAATSGEANLLGHTIQHARRLTSGKAEYPELLLSLGAVEIQALREHYWRLTDNEASGSGLQWIDKLPLNIFHLGFVRWIFPRARILVALRDPRDVVLSCFQQSFRPNRAMAHFLDIGSTVELYVTAMDLWLHYRDTVDDWMEYRYEDLASEPEATTRRIFEHLGLAWTKNVIDAERRAGNRVIATPSHADVTEPIYRRSIGRWHNYRAHLEPVLSDLAPYVAKFGYEPA